MTDRITNSERQRRAQSVANALASVRMEGLEPAAEAKEIFRKYIEGEISPQEKDKAFEALLKRSYGQ